MKKERDLGVGPHSYVLPLSHLPLAGWDFSQLCFLLVLESVSIILGQESQWESPDICLMKVAFQL